MVRPRLLTNVATWLVKSAANHGLSVQWPAVEPGQAPAMPAVDYHQQWQILGDTPSSCVVDCLRLFLLILRLVVLVVVVFGWMMFSPRNFLFHFSFSIILFKCLVHITCSQCTQSFCDPQVLWLHVVGVFFLYNCKKVHLILVASCVCFANWCTFTNIRLFVKAYSLDSQQGTLAAGWWWMCNKRLSRSIGFVGL